MNNGRLKLTGHYILKQVALAVSEYKVTVALKNKTDQLIRITNLNEQESLQLQDSDGFSVFSSCPVGDINIPRKSAVKSVFVFPADGTPKTLKIFEIEMEIPKELIK